MTAISCAWLLRFIPPRTPVVPKQVIPIWCHAISLIFLHLKMAYAHVIRGVPARYQIGSTRRRAAL